MPQSSGNIDSAGSIASRGKRIGEIHDGDYPILVHEAVLEEILEYSEQDTDRELGGFLTGNVQGGERRHVEVKHFLPAVDAHSKAASLTFTHETWAAMTREVGESHPDDAIVGWQHTHPGFGVFLSGYDLFIHRHFFNEPWQIAMVVDPREREFGFFQWRGNQVIDCGFVCVK